MFKFLLFFVTLSAALSATDHSPWLGNFYEFELESFVAYQHFSRVSSRKYLKKYRADNIFLNLSLQNSIPDPDIGFELELRGARTKKHKNGEIDQLKGTARWALLDDISGDPISLVAGLSYIQAFKCSLKDPSCFHHGLYHIELFLSIGKEDVNKGVLNFKWASLLAMGFAEKGSPWLRLNVFFEKYFCEKQSVGLFLYALGGLGKKNLHLHHFRGYGPLHHRSIDVGFNYQYLIDDDGSVNLKYFYRLYAKNFPAHAHEVILKILYTFGL